MKAKSLQTFIYLSIGAAVVTILLKFQAYRVTGSMGLLSDALESLVNLFAAIFALIMLNLSRKPADKKHAFGHGKAEYFSSATEGALILIAAFSIIWTAAPRLIDPRPIENVNVGLLYSLAAASPGGGGYLDGMGRDGTRCSWKRMGGTCSRTCSPPWGWLRES